MLAYEFFWLDEVGGSHFIGVMPERRKNRERVTQESVMNWGRTLFADTPELSRFFFIQVSIDEDTGRISKPTPFPRN